MDIKLLLLLVVPGLCLLGGCRSPVSRFATPTPALTATTGAGDHATVRSVGDAVVVAVTSATGIGALTLAWQEDAPPTALTLHLYLRGLEDLRLESAASQLTVAVLSRPPYAVIESAAVNGAPAAELTPDSPYWAAVTMEAASGAAAIPLEDGYFAVTVPPQLLADAQGSLTVHWVDFHR
jgi:hypothetical protein